MFVCFASNRRVAHPFPPSPSGTTPRNNKRQTAQVVRSPEQIKAGMAADQVGGADREDPNLVAYWKFDEGRGYAVKDVTGHGHDLIASEPPRWEVVRWLSSWCARGVCGWVG